MSTTAGLPAVLVPSPRSQTRSLHVVPKTSFPRTAVLGTGHGGLALAGYLADKGVPVRLWNRSAGPLLAVQALGGIQLDGRLARPERISSHIKDVTLGSDLLLVALPAPAHREVARSIAPWLTDGQMILLLPGRTGGALEFLRELTLNGLTADVIVGETETFPFASRVTSPGEASILGVKRRVAVAALPAIRTMDLLARCLPLLPMLVPARSVLATSFENMGAMLHPVTTLLNAGRIEGDPLGFMFYAEGLTPTVAQAVHSLDAERLRVARAYGIPARSLEEWLRDAYGRDDPDLGVALRQNPVYQSISAPLSLDHRYLWEDVPTGLVPLAQLGSAAGVPCPTMESLITLASTIHARDYRATGRTLASMGLLGLEPREARRMVEEGGVGR